MNKSKSKNEFVLPKLKSTNINQEPKQKRNLNTANQINSNFPTNKSSTKEIIFSSNDLINANNLDKILTANSTTKKIVAPTNTELKNKIDKNKVLLNKIKETVKDGNKIQSEINTTKKAVNTVNKKFDSKEKGNQDGNKKSSNINKVDNVTNNHNNKGRAVITKSDSKNKLVSFSKHLMQNSRLDVSSRSKTKQINETEYEDNDIENESFVNEMRNSINKYILNRSTQKKIVLNDKTQNSIEFSMYNKLKSHFKKLKDKVIDVDQNGVDNDKYELVEKVKLDKIHAENEDIKKNIKKLNEELDILKAKRFKDCSDLHNKLFMSKHQEGLKKDKIDYLNKKIAELEYLEEKNKNLKTSLTFMNIDRKNVLTAIISSLEKFDPNLKEEFLSFYNSYNNEIFNKKSFKNEDEEIELLLGKISMLNYQIYMEKGNN